MTSRSNTRGGLAEMMRTSDTLPFGCTTTCAMTRPLVPSRCAARGYTGSTRYAALYSRRTAGCGCGCGAMTGGGPGGGGAVETVVMVCDGGGGGAEMLISGGGMKGGGGAASFGGGGGGVSGGGFLISSMILVSSGALTISITLRPRPLTSAYPRAR